MARTAKKDNADLPSALYCVSCGKTFAEKEFYKTDSGLYAVTGKIPWCRDCIDRFYYDYLGKYKSEGYAEPEKKAIERMCMFLDIYFSDEAYLAAIKRREECGSSASIMLTYMGVTRLQQYKKKDYSRTLQERYDEAKIHDMPVSIYSDKDSDMNGKIEAATKRFGGGFDNNDYIYLDDQYNEWIMRHECNTKAQEEVFKNICLTQLQLRKAMLTGADTDKLSKQLQQWLDTGKLQPKQNAGDTVAENQTFGTLIDKWENTRPIPDVDEDLKDVDNIGLYLDVFFRGHLAKMAGVKNGLSNLYDKYMSKYTVEKPEYYNDDEDYEPLFDTIFGKSLSDED